MGEGKQNKSWTNFWRKTWTNFWLENPPKVDQCLTLQGKTYGTIGIAIGPLELPRVLR